MTTTETIYKYACSTEEWKSFIAAMGSGKFIEIDEEMYWYWLEVLPPVNMNKTIEIGGFEIATNFGFAEGYEKITYFWKTKTGKFFCRQSNQMNKWG